MTHSNQAKPHPFLPRYAESGLRFMALVIDSAILLIGWPFLATAIQPVLGQLPWLVGWGWPLVGLLYFVLMEGLCGQTVGKWWLVIKVVADDGRRCGLPAAIIRNLIRPIDMVGWVMMVRSPMRQRLGDRWSRTVVVKQFPQERRLWIDGVVSGGLAGCLAAVPVTGLLTKALNISVPAALVFALPIAAALAVLSVYLVVWPWKEIRHDLGSTGASRLAEVGRVLEAMDYRLQLKTDSMLVYWRSVPQGCLLGRSPEGKMTVLLQGDGAIIVGPQAHIVLLRHKLRA